VSTLVSFHAHPDDESIATGGSIAKAKAEGHRVVLVVATRGEHGEVAEGFLDAGETLADRRVVETHSSAAELGVDRVEFLGYVDSGMIGTPENDLPGSFWRADVEVAAARLAAILRDESAAVLTIYDEFGNYGHPDHIQVHRVGVRAAELAGVSRVFEATMNRDEMRRNIEEMRAHGDEATQEEMPDLDDENESFGMPEELITHAVGVEGFVTAKRRSMAAHASQIPPDSFFLRMPDDVFARAFGTEWFIRNGHPRPAGAPFGTDLFVD
jgi:LmbE family N-acetylglucosaminyl deacetylase